MNRLYIIRVISINMINCNFYNYFIFNFRGIYFISYVRSYELNTWIKLLHKLLLNSLNI
jgi:hypothetical protein